MEIIINEQINFLSDEPLDADREQEIRFGHLSIEETLREIISTCPTPFTIGLFGKWGTGKTTIINVVEKKLRCKEIGVVRFDVWKHEDDALRRTFLKETTRQLKEGEKNYLPCFDLSDRFDTTTSRQFQGPIIFHGKIIWGSVCFFVAVVGFGFLFNHLWPQSMGSYISIAVSGGLITAFLSFLLWLLNHAITTETVTKTTDRFKDPQEFETVFQELLKNMTSDRLLVVIDNLDRTSHKKAVELLATIKTFLGQKKCIFLIACDDEAIKKHLGTVYSSGSNETSNLTSDDSDEFLRKFFQASIRIPDFIDTELHTYTELLLKETRVDNMSSPDVAYVIARAFRGNPRQIKQFVNILLAYYLLAKKRERDSKPSIVPEGAVTTNIAFLAKLLIIRQNYPLEDYYKFIRDEETVDPELIAFLRVTRSIRTADTRPFHYLRISEEELDIPDVIGLELALIDGEDEKVEEKLKSIKEEPRQVTSFNKIISSLINRNKGNRLVLSHIITSLLVACKRLGLQLNRTVNNEVASILSDDSESGIELYDVDAPSVFDQVLTQCSLFDRDAIMERYIDSLKPQRVGEVIHKPSATYVQTVLTLLIDHKNWLGDKKQEINELLTDSYFNYDILSIFMGRHNDQKDVMSEDVVVKYVGTISGDGIEDSERLSDRILLLLDFKDIIGENALQAIITKLTGMLNSEIKQTHQLGQENVLTCIDDIFAAFNKDIAALDPDTLTPFVDTMISGINAAKNPAQKKIYMGPCLWLVTAFEDPLKSKLNTVIRPFFTDGDVASIDFVFQRLTDDQQKEIINTYNDIFKSRVSQDQHVFDLLYKLASKDIRTRWLVDLIRLSPQRAVAKIEGLGYRVDDKRSIVATILEKAGQVAPNEKEGLNRVCNKMKCANDKILKEKFASELKALLKHRDNNYQEAGFRALQDASYLSDTLKRDIDKNTVEWLRTLQPNDAGQESSTRSVLINWELLPLPVQIEFLDFIYDKLIIRGINTGNIKLGFEILRNIKPQPKYEDEEYSSYFDDIYSRTESESNTQITSELVTGLLSLKPEKLNSFNKDFWKKIAQLKT